MHYFIGASINHVDSWGGEISQMTNLLHIKSMKGGGVKIPKNLTPWFMNGTYIATSKQSSTGYWHEYILKRWNSHYKNEMFTFIALRWSIKIWN